MLGLILGEKWQERNTVVMKTHLEAICFSETRTSNFRIVKFNRLCLGKKKYYKVLNYSIK